MQKQNRRDFITAAGALAAASALPSWSQQAGWPNKPIRILVGFPPGGGADALARVVGEKLQTLWKQPVVIDNKPGASGTLRMPTLADVPTFEEQGFKGYNVVDWKAVAGPRGIPADVVAFLNRELNEVLRHKAVTEKFEAEGTTAVGGTPEQMMEIVRADVERWKRVAADAKVKIE